MLSKHLLGRFLRRSGRGGNSRLIENDISYDELADMAVRTLCAIYTLERWDNDEFFLTHHAELIRAVVHGEGPNPTKPAKRKKSKESRHASGAQSDSFLQSYEWRKVRMQALIRDGSRCQCCGATPATGATMNVDHIKPRKTHPHLALSLGNLQVLCGACNHGKGNWDTTDWRKRPY